MMQRNFTFFLSPLVAIITLLYSLCPAITFAWHTDFPTYESYIDYLTSQDHPNNLDSDWTDNVQGITNDGLYWYITQKTKLIRAPEIADLADNLYQYGYTELSNWPELSGYEHFGDISFFDPDPNDGQSGYILVPVDSAPSYARLALFQANETLTYIGSDVFAGQGHNAGWVAVGPDGTVYSSENAPTEIRKYQVNWNDIQQGANVEVTYTGSLQLRDYDGAPLDDNSSQKLTRMQGGVITPTGAVLFLVNGFYFNEPGDESWGVHAFSIGPYSCTRIARSCNNGDECIFHYEFHPENTFGEEPEGLTIWDQDFGQAPSIDGQLHVLMSRQNAFGDEVYLKHFTFRKVIYNSDDIQLTHDNAWSGSVLSLQAGEYHQSILIDKKVLIEAPFGTAIITGQ